MTTIPNNVYYIIWKYIYPVTDINNIKIDNSINNVLTRSGYCDKCGENNKSFNCEHCNAVLYYYCRYCMNATGDNLICCYESYKDNFIF